MKLIRTGLVAAALTFAPSAFAETKAPGAEGKAAAQAKVKKEFPAVLSTMQGLIKKTDDSNVKLVVGESEYEVIGEKESKLIEHAEQQVKVTGELKSENGNNTFEIKNYSIVKKRSTKAKA